jgi:chromate transporter
VALITLPVFSMAKSARLTRRNCWIPVLSTLLIWLCGVSPVYIIAAAGIGGYLYGRWLEAHPKDKNNEPS